MSLRLAVVLCVFALVIVSTRLLLESLSLDHFHFFGRTIYEVQDEDEGAPDHIKRPIKERSLRSYRNNVSPISEESRVRYEGGVSPLKEKELPGNHSEESREKTNHLGAKVTKEGFDVATRLKILLTRPTTTCQRLVRVGGRSCIRAYDGSKLVCLDKDVKLQPLNCLLYSFGVGNDFTFDEHMQDFGCEVHAFDHDNDHEIYDYRLGPTAFFHKSRIGFKTGYFRFCERTPNGSKCDPAIRYQTMADIRRSLRHEHRQLHYLKMDIEGGEWQVLKQVLSTALLSNVSQVSLEIHLERLRSEKTPAGKRAAVASYLNVIQSLLKLGFQLVSYDENGLNPQYEMVDGVQLSLYAELLFIRRKRGVKVV